jgi:hypothetical protein
MIDLAVTIAFLKHLRRDLLKDVEELEAGSIIIEKTRKGERINITAEKLAEQKHRLGNLDQAISAYEFS